MGKISRLRRQDKVFLAIAVLYCVVQLAAIVLSFWHEWLLIPILVCCLTAEWSWRKHGPK